MTIAARALIAETGICRVRPAEPIRCGRAAKIAQTAVDILRTAAEKLTATVEILYIAVEMLTETVEILHIAVEIPDVTVGILHIAVEKLSVTVDILPIAVENPAARAPAWARSMKTCPGRSAWTRMISVKTHPQSGGRSARAMSDRLLTGRCTQIPR